MENPKENLYYTIRLRALADRVLRKKIEANYNERIKNVNDHFSENKEGLSEEEVAESKAAALNQARLDYNTWLNDLNDHINSAHSDALERLLYKEGYDPEAEFEREVGPLNVESENKTDYAELALKHAMNHLPGRRDLRDRARDIETEEEFDDFMNYLQRSISGANKRALQDANQPLVEALNTINSSINKLPPAPPPATPPATPGTWGPGSAQSEFLTRQANIQADAMARRGFKDRAAAEQAERLSDPLDSLFRRDPRQMGPFVKKILWGTTFQPGALLPVNQEGPRGERARMWNATRNTARFAFRLPLNIGKSIYYVGPKVAKIPGMIWELMNSKPGEAMFKPPEAKKEEKN